MGRTISSSCGARGRPRASGRSTRTPSFPRGRSMPAPPRWAAPLRRWRRWRWAKSDNAFCAIRPPGHHAEIASRWASASSTPSPSWHARRSANTAPSGWRSSISTCTTATARRTSSGGRSVLLRLEPPDAAVSRHGRRARRAWATSSTCAVGDPYGGEEMREGYDARICPALEDFAPDLHPDLGRLRRRLSRPAGGLNWVPDRLRLAHRPAHGDRRGAARAASCRCSRAATTAAGSPTGAAAHVGMLMGARTRRGRCARRSTRG
jgi:hypothetical protein